MKCIEFFRLRLAVLALLPGKLRQHGSLVEVRYVCLALQARRNGHDALLSPSFTAGEDLSKLNPAGKRMHAVAEEYWEKRAHGPAGEPLSFAEGGGAAAEITSLPHAFTQLRMRGSTASCSR